MSKIHTELKHIGTRLFDKFLRGIIKVKKDYENLLLITIRSANNKINNHVYF